MNDQPFKGLPDGFEHQGKLLDPNRTATLSYEMRAAIEEVLPNHPELKGWLDTMDHCEIISADRKTLMDRFLRPGANVFAALKQRQNGMREEIGGNLVDAVQDIFREYEDKGTPLASYAEIFYKLFANPRILDDKNSGILASRYENTHHGQNIFALDEAQKQQLIGSFERYQRLEDVRADYDAEYLMLQNAAKGRV